MSERPVKILMVAPSGGGHGGVEIYTAAIAKDVLDSGECEVRVVYRVPNGTPVRETLAKSVGVFGINWRVIHSLDIQYLKDLLWADVIHCHFPLIYATYPARLLGKKLVATVEAKRQHPHGARFKIGLELAHAQWFISKFVAETWGKTRFDERCKIVPATSDLPSTYVEPASRKGFFFIARWVPLKGLEQIVESYATADIDHRVHPLFLYGDGILREKILAMISDLKMEEFVQTPGFVSAGEKEARMASSRWNLAPVAFQEDLGLTPIEARCCSVPSIVSRAGGVPEGAGDQALLCQPGDIASLRQAMEQAASMDEAEYAARSKACHDSLESYLPKPGFYYSEYLRLLNR